MSFSQRGQHWIAGLDRALGFPRERRRFRRRHGYPPNLRQPRSFNEKIVWRKLFDRNPDFVRVADKVEVRDYLCEVLGRDQAEPHLVPLQQVCERAEELQLDQLTRPCVIKPSHSSGRVMFLRGDDHEPGSKAVQAQCNQWLREYDYGIRRHEWVYTCLQPRIMVEELLDDGSGQAPPDYKFFVFHGRLEMVHVDLDRFQGHRRSVFDRDWRHLDLEYEFPRGPDLPRPSGFDTMRDLAERAAAGFDFMRVDLYNIDGHIYFGELTCYPASGRGHFTPTDFDFQLGSKWRIPA